MEKQECDRNVQKMEAGTNSGSEDESDVAQKIETDRKDRKGGKGVSSGFGSAVDR